MSKVQILSQLLSDGASPFHIASCLNIVNHSPGNCHRIDSKMPVKPMIFHRHHCVQINLGQLAKTGVPFFFPNGSHLFFQAHFFHCLPVHSISLSGNGKPAQTCHTYHKENHRPNYHTHFHGITAPFCLFLMIPV